MWRAHPSGRTGGREPHDILVPGMPELERAPLRRVGHKGADLIAPGNTFESFDAALEAGVDMIEFDVLPSRDRRQLLLAHDYEDAAGRRPHTLEEGLTHLASEAFAGIELDVDLKLPGYELRVIEALRAARLLLPARAGRAIRQRACDALMAHWRLVTPRLVRVVRDAGGELYAWTVDEPRRLRALEALGVTGVITNDPRLFAG